MEFLFEYQKNEKNAIKEIEQFLLESKSSKLDTQSKNEEIHQSYKEKPQFEATFLKLLKEIKSLKKKTQKILINLRENKDFEENNLISLIPELKLALKLFSEDTDSNLEKLLSNGNNKRENLKNKYSESKENALYLENQGIKTEINKEESNLDQKSLKIYQFESDLAYEIDNSLMNNNYNFVKKPKQKNESGLFKELTNFLDKNQKNINLEIIDFSDKTLKKNNITTKEVAQPSKIKINLNDIKMFNVKPLVCLQESDFND